MKLSKLLRKHSRTLIIVFMSLLLVAFLVPNSITNMTRSGGGSAIAVGEVYGEKVTTQDLDRTESELNIVRRVGVQLLVPQDPVLAYLMAREAEQAGIRVGRDEVKQLLIRGGISDERLRMVQNFAGCSYDTIYDIVGRWLAADRLRRFQTAALGKSLPREKVAYRNQNQQAIARLSLIPVDAFVDQIPEPTEEELAAFFEECKGRPMNHTETQLEFGYLYPDRVRLEYLTVDPTAVQPTIKLKGIQVQQFFEQNRGRYTKPDPQATPAPSGKVPQIPMTFDEAQEQVRADLRKARAIEEAQKIVNEMQMDAHRPWVTAPRDEEGFARPVDGGVVSFEELQQRYSRDFKVQHGTTDLLDSAGLRTVPGLGNARYAAGQQALLVPDLAMRVEGLLDDPQAALQGGMPVLSINEPAPVVMRWQFDRAIGRQLPYQAYVFRVTEAKPSAPPASIDEVRDRIVGDWKLVQAFELARVRAEQLAAAAAEVGLTDAVAQATDLRAEIESAARATTQATGPDARSTMPGWLRELEPFETRMTRRSGYIQRVGQATGLQERLFELADQPADDGHRVTAVPLATQDKWIVAQLDEITPVYEGAFEDQLAAAFMRSQREEQQVILMGWLDPENIWARTGFKPTAAMQAAAGQ
jgi:hypothetical protein